METTNNATTSMRQPIRENSPGSQKKQQQQPNLGNDDDGGHDYAGNNRKESLDENRTVRHIMVIGFHHKHGYQVDYCYPPLTPDGPIFSTPQRPIVLPPCWKTLPILCLPDGSHNYNNDTIYFTMPDFNQEDPVRIINEDLNNSQQENGCIKAEGILTIFGTACYRQISVQKLVNKTDDMTRLSVQKSVCVLSLKPLFGLIRSKLEMITHAYFEELDFSKVKILKLTYENLNSLLSRESVKENAIFLGLSTRELVSTFGCQILVIFKAILLEKRILFYKSPVRELCTTILSMCSLFTGLLECGGLDRSTCDLQLSPTLIEALRLSTSSGAVNDCDSDDQELTTSPLRDDKVFFSSGREEVVIIPDSSFSDNQAFSANNNSISKGQLNGDLNDSKQSNDGCDIKKQQQQRDTSIENELTKSLDFEIISSAGELIKTPGSEECEDNETNPTSEELLIDDHYIHKLCRMKLEDCGLPLQVFSRGSFCLPYLSISYLDLLSDPRVKSFVIGATNFLFKQRRELYDVIVDMEDGLCKVDIVDPNLKKCLSLTTEDLRFVDYLNKNVKLDESKRSRDEFDFMNQDITKWLGSDEWIRYLFRLYILYLLKANKCNSNIDTFNTAFVHAWRQTNNYKIWDSLGKSSVLAGLKNKHPFSSPSKGLNFNDVKLRLSYAVNSSEKGKLINQTLSGIGKWSIWNSVSQSLTIPNQIISVSPTARQSPKQHQQQTNKEHDDKQANK